MDRDNSALVAVHVDQPYCWHHNPLVSVAMTMPVQTVMVGAVPSSNSQVVTHIHEREFCIASGMELQI